MLNVNEILQICLDSFSPYTIERKPLRDIFLILNISLNKVFLRVSIYWKAGRKNTKFKLKSESFLVEKVI